MNTLPRLTICLLIIFFSTQVFSQHDRCGTMRVMNEMIQKDPSLQINLEASERELQQTIKERRMDQQIPPSTRKGMEKSRLPAASLCGYDNVLYQTLSAPVTLNAIVSASQNCVFAGEFVRVTNLLKGNTYRISTCGAGNFDTQLTIYTQGGAQAVAHNDDWCGPQAEIYFTPTATGDYDILVDEYNCLSNNLCSSLDIELWYQPRATIVIPTVIHVLHNGEAIGTGRNISDAQIKSQIAVLNEDFRRMNADLSMVPAAFRGSAMDLMVEFCLAQQDESGLPTTGITRHQTNYPTVTTNDLQKTIKPTTIWNRDQYLNIWVVDFDPSELGLLGYAQFPGMPANTDGVAIRYTVFGNTGNVNPPFNKGRTTTHEVGHWLHLKHIWGDDNDCSGTDQVADTPNQELSSTGTPTFPRVDSCTKAYPGIMFYNYMDYCDDVTLAMFTYGQAVRVDGTLFSGRKSLLTSNGCKVSTSGVAEYQKNQLELYPNPSSGLIYFKGTQVYTRATLWDIFGKEVMSKNLSGESLDVSGLSSGLYFVTFSTTNASVTKKIIIQ